jgi:succinate-acetate transporter protein
MGLSMNDNQSGETKKKPFSPRRIALLGAGATALAVLNMMTNGAEAQSPWVVILQYAALAGGLVALVGGLIMMAMAPKN